MLRQPALLAFKGSLSALVTGGLVLLATAGLLRSPALRAAFAGLVPALSYVVFVSGVLLAWRFDRIRVIFALVAIALATWGVSLFPVAGLKDTLPGAVVWGGIALILPLDLGLFAWFTERGLLSPYGKLNAALLAAETIVVALLCGDAALARPRLLARIGEFAHFPAPALLAFATALVLVAVRFALRRGAVEAGFLWALVAAFLALTSGGSALETVLYFTAGGLILVVSLIEESYALAYLDELTSLPGRRALNAALLKLGPRYAIAMIDIDHFKKFNDTHGHHVGDQVLRKVAAALAQVGGGGQAFRYGGEEFAVLFSGRSVDETLRHLEQLRQAIEASEFLVRAPDRPLKKPAAAAPVLRASTTLHITISIGAAEPTRRAATPNQVLDAADTALFRAKQAGRNRVSI